MPLPNSTGTRTPAPGTSTPGQTTADRPALPPGTGPLPVSALADVLAQSFEGQAADNPPTLATEPGAEPGRTDAPPPETDAPPPDNAEPPPVTETPDESPTEQPPEGQEQEQGQEQELEPGQDPEGVKKRIGRLQARIRELEANQRPTRSQPGDQHLQEVTDAGELDVRQERAEAGLEECDALMAKLAVAPSRVEAYLRSNGIVLKNEQGEEDFSAERVADFLGNARTQFRQTLKAIPRRRQYLADYDQAHAQAVQVKPWINDVGDERQAMMATIVNQFPGLKLRPNWEYWVACAIEGHMATQTALKAKTNGHARTATGTRTPMATRRPMPSSGGSGNPRPQPRGDQAKVATAKQRVIKEGTRRALSAFLDTVGVH